MNRYLCNVSGSSKTPFQRILVGMKLCIAKWVSHICDLSGNEGNSFAQTVDCRISLLYGLICRNSTACDK